MPPNQDPYRAPEQPQSPQNGYTPPQLQPQQYSYHDEQSSQPEGGRYDFFLDPKQAGRKSKMPSLGGGFMKILLFALAAFGLLGVLAVILSSSKSGDDTAPLLTSIARDQQEIIRVTTLAIPNVDSPRLQNFATTALVTTTSAQKEYLAYMGKISIKIDEKQLAAVTNPQTDQALEAALAASTYDTTFESTMRTLLGGYQEKLERANNVATTEPTKAILGTNIQSSKLLLEMLGGTTAATPSSP